MTNKKYPGYLLVANPNNPRDDISRSVMLIVSHTADVSVALQVNNPVEDLDLQSVAENLGVEYPVKDPLFYGGNANTNKIHVIHSSEWSGLSTAKLNDEISVTSDISVLTAIGNGSGPEFYRACAGYWIWNGGLLDLQLDSKYKDDPHKWEITPADLENVFNGEGPDQWRYALEACARYQVSEWF